MTTLAPETVCYYCLYYLNDEGYGLVNQGRLKLVPANCRCDYCERRENGKLYVRTGRCME